MRREIKFRVFDRPNKTFIHSAEALEIYRVGGGLKLYVGVDYAFERAYDEFVIEQFTGQLDSNGREVYEGDIMKHPKNESLGVVEYNPFESKFYMGSDGYSYGGGVVNLIVIGNIHENPELLEAVV
jgi:uncharacterized phage protein (TIGR01671 family)